MGRRSQTGGPAASVALLGLLLATAPSPAQSAALGEKSPTLSIGDPAPPVRIGKWVKGPAVAGFEKGKVYVIDVWATWCIPCVAAMPHATGLQKRFGERGLVVVGVTATDSFGNSEEAVRKLVARKGEGVGFAVGIDETSDSPEAYLGVFRGKTVEAYLGGAWVPALPAAFVVDRRGRVAFIGHPLEVDAAVEGCLDGTWDLRAAREQRAARGEAQGLLVEFEKAVKAGDHERGLSLARRLVREVPHGEPRVFAGVAGLMADGDAALARRAPDLALDAGRRAVDLTKAQDPGPLSALANVYFARGEVEKAVEAVTRAISLSEGGLKPVLEKQLERYRAAARRER
jgi:thiol-disulfide isomerase/thioredoxin